MITENLHVGLVAKNYKHMCLLLGESVMKGKSRQLQLKRWGCYFEHENSGQKWTITEIFDDPKELVKGGISLHT